MMGRRQSMSGLQVDAVSTRQRARTALRRYGKRSLNRQERRDGRVDIPTADIAFGDDEMDREVREADACEAGLPCAHCDMRDRR